MVYRLVFLDCPEEINLGAGIVFWHGVKTLANFMWNSVDLVTVREFLNIFYLEIFFNVLLKKTPHFEKTVLWKYW